VNLFSQLPKKISEIQKKEMAEAFIGGKSIADIANKYGLKNLTITKYLKTLFSEAEFKKIKKANISKLANISTLEDRIDNSLSSINYSESSKKLIKNQEKYIEDQNKIEEIISGDESFYEIKPLDQSFDFENRKDLTSKPLKEFTIPQNTYMVIDNNIELEDLYIRDFPEYSYLSEVDQKRKIIKLFSDKKLANSFCNKNQKIIKVPNGNVFILVSQFLLEKGISRIIYDDLLLSI